jgi:endonuclease/exonuclease/phosphatase family metal-dependent hydrolase
MDEASARVPATRGTQPEQGRLVRIASYNVHRCIGGDGRCEPARVVDVIHELDCDLIALQEVDNSPGSTPTSMQLEYLVRSTGMSAAAGLRLVRHMGHYGNALLSRHAIVDVRRHDLSHSWFEPRGALDVDVDIDGIASRIVVTHLGLAPHERRHQMRKILEILATTPGHVPLALLGDINEWLPVIGPVRWLDAHFGRPPSARSWPARWPVLALDRIWARPAGSLLSVRAHRSEVSRAASDHLPVVAEWSLPRAQAGQPPHAAGVAPGEGTGALTSEDESRDSESGSEQPVSSLLSG